MSDQGISAPTVQNEVLATGEKKAGKQRKLDGVLDGTTELYRHYDSWGRLLYVGVSLSSLGRLADHRTTCSWFKLIKMIAVDLYPTRALALQAERDAIEKEKPYFNRVHRRGWKDVRWNPGDGLRAGDELAHLLKTTSSRKNKH